MSAIKTILTLCILLTLFEIHQCGRSSGGYADNLEDSEIQSVLSVDEPRGPPLEALAYGRTTARARTTARRATSRPATARRTTPRPATARRTTPRPTTARRTTPRPTTPRRTTTVRRTTTPRPTTRYTTPRSTTRYTTPRTTTAYWLDRNTHRTTHRPTTTTRRTTTQNWKDVTRRTTPRRTSTRTTTRYTTPRTTKLSKKEWTYQDLPPVPGKGSKPGKTKVVIKNTYNYHYPGFYTVPVAHHQYPGYYQTYSSYRYSPSDTGSGILGFYLGYKLAQLSTPTYSHQSFYDGYRPRYDHYTVHHYYHNADSVPREQKLPSNAIVGCVGDSTAVCPSGTVSLCTSDGTLMCVVSAANIVDCTDANNRPAKCTKSTISCKNNDAPECKTTTSKTAVVNIPCVSTAKVEGVIKYVNNSIVKTTREDLLREQERKNAFIRNISVNCTRIISCVNNTSPECTNRANISVNATCILGSTKFITNVTPDGKQIHCIAKMVCINNTSPECINKTLIKVNVTCPPNKKIANNSTILNGTHCIATIPCNNISSPECLNKTSISINATCTQQPIHYLNGTIGNTTHCTGNISCQNNTAPECANKTNLILNVTCDANFTEGQIKYVNNPLMTDLNSTDSVHTQGDMKYVNNPQMTNLSTDSVPITTLPTTTLPPTTSEHWRWKRSAPEPPTQHDFCVAVVAVPAQRQPTQGEEFLSDAGSIFKSFVESAWNL